MKYTRRATRAKRSNRKTRQRGGFSFFESEKEKEKRLAREAANAAYYEEEAKQAQIARNKEANRVKMLGKRDKKAAIAAKAAYNAGQTGMPKRGGGWFGETADEKAKRRQREEEQQKAILNQAAAAKAARNAMWAAKKDKKVKGP